jgi:tripartite-type tricarboxylate transporter receptor subunit TctC
MKGYERRQFIATAGAIAAGQLTAPARAQAFPSKPLRFVIPFATGGPTDIMTRILASRLSVEMKQQVISENRIGAGGNIGAEYVARSAPDGYTLLVGTNGTLAANQSLFEKLTYNPVTDFEPVSFFVFLPNMLAVNPSVPAKNVRELINWIKANPGQAFASGGLGTSTHFAGELFRSMAGLDLQHVPYKGDGQSVPDVISGNVPILFCSVLAGMKWVAEGRLRVLGVTSASRVPVIRDVPPVAESGLPGYDLTSWYAIVVPAGTPKDITRVLNAGLVSAMSNPDLKSKIEAMGGIVAPGTPEQLRDHIQAEIPRWAKLVKEVNIKL